MKFGAERLPDFNSEQQRAVELALAALEGIEPIRVGWFRAAWWQKSIWDYYREWNISPEVTPKDVAINGILGRHLEIREREPGVFFGIHIQEVATVSRTRRELNILQVTGTAEESVPGWTDFSSREERAQWSYDLLNDQLRPETSQALMELLEKRRISDADSRLHFTYRDIVDPRLKPTE